MSDQELEFMRAAIDAARQSPSDSTGKIPRVGAVAVRQGQILGTAFRGQQQKDDPKDHAEYVLLEKLLPNEPLADATS